MEAIQSSRTYLDFHGLKAVISQKREIFITSSMKPQILENLVCIVKDIARHYIVLSHVVSSGDVISRTNWRHFSCLEYIIPLLIRQDLEICLEAVPEASNSCTPTSPPKEVHGKAIICE
jgi:hypothetical protein